MIQFIALIFYALMGNTKCPGTRVIIPKPQKVLDFKIIKQSVYDTCYTITDSTGKKHPVGPYQINPPLL